MGYGTFDPKAAEEAAKKKTSGGKNYKVPDSGENVYFCPPWNENERLPFRELYLHYNFGEEGAISCLKQFGKVCPLCSASSELRNDKDNPIVKKMWEEGGAIYAKKYRLYNVIAGVNYVMGQDRKTYIVFNPTTERPEPIVQVYPVGVKLQPVIDGFHTACGDIYNPMNAVIIQLTKLKSGTNPKFWSTMGIPIATQRGMLEPKLLNLVNNLRDLNVEYPEQSIDKLKNLADLKLAEYRAHKSMGFNPSQQSIPSIAYQSPTPAMPSFPNSGFVPNNPQTIISGPAPVPVIPTTGNFTPPPSNVSSLDDFEKSLRAKSGK